jgi:hypothetical protein
MYKRNKNGAYDGIYLDYAYQDGHDYVVEYDLQPEKSNIQDWAGTEGLFTIGAHNECFEKSYPSYDENGEGVGAPYDYLTVTRTAVNKSISMAMDDYKNTDGTLEIKGLLISEGDEKEEKYPLGEPSSLLHVVMRGKYKTPTGGKTKSSCFWI